MIYEKNKYLYRDDGSIWFDEWEFVRPVFFTGNVNKYYASGKVERMKKNNLSFLDNLHSKVFRKNRKEITRLIVVEKGMKNKKLHTHMIIDTPKHLSQKTFERFIKKSWESTKGGIEDSHFEKVWFQPDLKEYLGKDQNLQTERGVDEMNSCTNKSVSINS